MTSLQLEKDKGHHAKKVHTLLLLYRNPQEIAVFNIKIYILQELSQGGGNDHK